MLITRESRCRCIHCLLSINNYFNERLKSKSDKHGVMQKLSAFLKNFLAELRQDDSPVGELAAINRLAPVGDFL